MSKRFIFWGTSEQHLCQADISDSANGILSGDTETSGEATYYAKAGGWTGGLPLVKDGVSVSSKVEMEDGSTGRTPTIVRDVILLDGVEQGSGSVGDQGSYLQWEDETDADFGSGLSIADLQYRRNDDFVLEQSTTFNETIALSLGE